MILPENHRLLVVDDNADDHFLFCATLRRAKISNSIDYLAGGQDAIHYLEGCLCGLKEWPCVVFLDINMPMVDGFEVLRWARENGVAGRTVIAMMSTSSLRSDISRSFSLGAHLYISKSAKPDGLLELIRTATSFASPQEAAASIRPTSIVDDGRASWE